MSRLLVKFTRIIVLDGLESSIREPDIYVSQPLSMQRQQDGHKLRAVDGQRFRRVDDGRTKIDTKNIGLTFLWQVENG